MTTWKRQVENRRNFLKLAGLGAASLAVSSCASLKNKAQNPQPNVLMVVIDDLNDWISVLDHPIVKTPNFERLARRSVTFNNAYCPAPICCPSRTSFLTGMHPSKSGAYFNNQRFFTSNYPIGKATTLPGHFKKNGYDVVSYGKVFHINRTGLDIKETEIDFVKNDFNKGQYIPKVGEKGKLKKAVGYKLYSLGGQYPWVWGPLPDDWDRDDESKTQQDTRNANRMAKFIKSDHDKPFWAALGIYRPHSMYFAAQRYYNLYPLDSIKPPPGYKEDDLSDVAPVHNLMRRQGVHELLKKRDLWRQAIQGYMACITYADEQLGKVLDALEASPHNDNTIIVVCGDNGYHNMEKDMWTKNILWERACKVPLLISFPKHTKPGFTSETPVGLIDIYPTLVSLCDLPNPKTHSLDGEDLTAIIKKNKKHRKRPVITTLGRGNHSIRSQQYRYIRFRNGQEELYDMQKDRWEWTNLAGDPKYASVIKRHRKHLPKTNAPDIEYFAYGHSKAQEQYGFHNPADMDKVIKELNKND